MSKSSHHEIHELHSRSVHKLIRMPRSTWDWIEKSYILLALGGIVFTAIAFWLGGSAKEILLSIAVLLFFLLASFLSVALSYVNGEKARYAEVLEHLHRCCHTIRDLHLFIVSERTDADDLKRRVQHDLCKITDCLVMALSLVSGTRIQVSISFTRIEVNHNDEIGVYVVARDSASRTDAKHRDAVTDVHLTKDNTALRSILERDMSYYYNGQVHKSMDFVSTTFEKFPNDPKYKSLLVLPIRCLSERSTASRERYCGFIQIESQAQKALTTRYDVDFCATIADSLYMPLSAFARKFPRR